MNGWITNTDYLNQAAERFNAAKALISEELPKMEQAQKAFYESVRAGEAKVHVDDVVKILGALKAQKAAIQP